MTLGEYLRMRLTADAGVAALVGDRVYSEVLPEAPTLPALVFAEFGGDGDAAMDGPTGVDTRSVQVDAWAAKRIESSRLARAVRAALDGHSGGAVGFDVQGVFFSSERWDVEPGVNPSDTKYRTSQDYDVVFGGVES